jgi:hypothetical protein
MFGSATGDGIMGIRWNLWDQKYTAADRTIEDICFLPFWRLSNVKNFKFYFTAGFQSMMNRIIIAAGLMGQDIRTESHYFAMMSDPLCDDVADWVLEDRAIFLRKMLKSSISVYSW